MTKRQRRIVAKIADSCLLAVNSGWRIVPGPNHGFDCMCPMGACANKPDYGVFPRREANMFLSKRYTTMSQAGLSERETEAFIRGFDSGSGGNSWSAKLGRAYRDWSAKKYGWAE